MENNRYNIKEWQNKRMDILTRDNFTCQNCKTFNPSIGLVEIYNKNDSSLELHQYESSPMHSLYRISSQKTGITLEIEFGLDWLVLPILQVHHKRYIDNRDVWDYDDSDLVTLCKDCHTLVHESLDIPVFDSKGQLLVEKRFSVIDEGCGHKHQFKPWIFINMDYSKREYNITKVKPTLRFFVFSHDYERIDEMKKDADKMCKDFFEQFLPDYMIDTNK